MMQTSSSSQSSLPAARRALWAISFYQLWECQQVTLVAIVLQLLVHRLFNICAPLGWVEVVVHGAICPRAEERRATPTMVKWARLGRCWREGALRLRARDSLFSGQIFHGWDLAARSRRRQSQMRFHCRLILFSSSCCCCCWLLLLLLLVLQCWVVVEGCRALGLGGMVVLGAPGHVVGQRVFPVCLLLLGDHHV